MHRLRPVGLSALLVGLAALGGCGQSMGQVDGKVVWTDGSPAVELANGQVIFESQPMRISARGEITKDATFTLRTSKEGDGAQVGDYDVAIVEHRVTPEGKQPPPPKLPEKYYDFKTSGLKATVKPGRTPVTLTVERVTARK